MTVDEKLAIKNLQANQYIIIHSTDKGGKIVIMKRNKKTTIGQYFLQTNK